MFVKVAWQVSLEHEIDLNRLERRRRLAFGDRVGNRGQELEISRLLGLDGPGGLLLTNEGLDIVPQLKQQFMNPCGKQSGPLFSGVSGAPASKPIMESAGVLLSKAQGKKPWKGYPTLGLRSVVISTIGSKRLRSVGNAEGDGSAVKSAQKIACCPQSIDGS